MFHVRKSSTDHIASTVAFTLLLASWCIAYVVIMPADFMPARHHVAALVRL